jgi:hypothetical protein
MNAIVLILALIALPFMLRLTLSFSAAAGAIWRNEYDFRRTKGIRASVDKNGKFKIK